MNTPPRLFECARWATPAELAARTHGEVTAAELYDYHSFRPANGGLFDESIFGELSTVGDADAQFEFLKTAFARRFSPTEPLAFRFGHISLPVPIPHPLLWTRHPETLARLTGWGLDKLSGLLEGDLVIARDTNEVVEAKDAGGPWIGGPGAVAQRLKDLPLLSLDRILVVPPVARPLRDSQSGGVEAATTNDLYRRVISLRNRLVKLIELDVPAHLLNGEEQKLFAAAVALFDNEMCAEPIERESIPHRSLMSLASPERLGLLEDGKPEAVDMETLACLRAVEAMGFTVEA